MQVPADKLDDRIEFLAGTISTSIDDSSSSISMRFMEQDLKEGLDLFMQVLLQPAFAQNRIDLAKMNMRKSLDSRNDSASSITNYQLGYLLNGENHYSTAAMTTSSLDSLTRDDCRSFHQGLMHPGNMAIAVSGRFEKKTMLDILNATVGRLKPMGEARISRKVPAPEHTRQPGIYVVDKNVPQSTVRIVIPGLRRTDSDWHAAVVMNQILGGGGFSSRLMKHLRSDEGLTYGVETRVSPGTYWTGDFICGLQTKNRSVPYALRLILDEIDLIRRSPVADDELKVIKDAIVQAYPSEWGNKQAVANRLAEEWMEGWPVDWWVNYREKIQSVTAEEVLRVAKKYLDPTRVVILVVGKAAEVEAGDEKDHPGLLKDVANLPLRRLSLRDPETNRIVDSK
ncbi:hypothetical protein GETHLI_19550 [Geothrix limicola]|uniref:Peptidase M16 C-terminal domain-containing protein n=2 Tax=Geothrix limicola TaxID=2927978 RepID=A0ABQ5QGH2_9BACT|nr:hypothetical protein GETHLI_19550 [Geothrix limicola]